MLTADFKYIATVLLLAFSLPIVATLSPKPEIKMFWVSLWAVCYFLINIAHNYHRHQKYNFQLIQEYALISILGIALVAGVIYYE